jgi:hypothetical protein
VGGRELDLVHLGGGLADTSTRFQATDLRPEVGIHEPEPGRHGGAIAQDGLVLYHYRLAIRPPDDDCEISRRRASEQRHDASLIIRRRCAGWVTSRQRQNSSECNIRASMPELGWEPMLAPCAEEAPRVVGVVGVVVVVAMPRGGSSADALGATGPREPGSPE